MEHIVVLGGGYAGTLAAVRMARRRLRVTLVTASPVLVERVRLHQALAGQSQAGLDLAALGRKAGFALLVGKATAWDPASQSLIVDGKTVVYDKLVYALGSQTDADRVPGIRQHATTYEAIKAPRGRVVVCGGGLTAIETATELSADPALDVSIVTAGNLGGFLSAPAQAYLRRVCARLRIRIIDQTPISEIRAQAVVSDGKQIPFDVCYWAGGFVANPLARAAGLPVNERGQLIVDETLTVPGHPNIFGAGDAVDPQLGHPMKMACKTAMPMGAHVADVITATLAGQRPAAFRFADSIYCISLGRKDGLVQFLDADSGLRDKIWTGRLAAFVKELICRYTIWSMRLEAGGWFHYRWLRGALPAGETRRLLA